MMTLPSLILGLILSLLIGALFHAWRDGGGGRLLFFLALSLAGFTAGHLLGTWRGWMLFAIGPLNAGWGVIGSLIFLMLGNWLSRIEIRSSDEDGDGV